MIQQIANILRQIARGNGRAVDQLIDICPQLADGTWRKCVPPPGHRWAHAKQPEEIAEYILDLTESPVARNPVAELSAPARREQASARPIAEFLPHDDVPLDSQANQSLIEALQGLSDESDRPGSTDRSTEQWRARVSKAHNSVLRGF